ncbi:MAG: Holliday junction branch migration protein RuvA [Parcubacteria group bacterium]
MIYALHGITEEIHVNFAVLAVSGGESYKVFMPQGDLGALQKGKEIKLFTCLYSREDGMDLYGFLSEEERDLFETLNTVSGVGPKAAIGILGLGPTDQIKAAIREGKTETLTKSFGIGKKTAERIVVELRDKIKGGGDAPEWDEDVYDALIKLGYRRDAAKEAVRKVNKETKDINERLKEALKYIK